MQGVFFRVTRIGLVAALGAGLSGCGSTAQNSDVGLVHTGLGGRAPIADVSAVEITETGPALAKEDQRVMGTSCRNKAWDPEPSRDNAINLMKQQAVSRGYNAVHSVKVFNDPAALVKNCWSALIASGIAYKQ
ncbi:hypothetical protein ACQZ61_04225 [Agrobacterium vitis]|uniref:hypothetical protein n=1 Tax=Agrobacterium vitis TaxID=373 RepID=UPI001F47B36F|nr:hypothetical protein [Agrobacterium vitis]MCF1452268.1 hypothetical protein [Agrobacterium vitis]